MLRRNATNVVDVVSSKTFGEMADGSLSISRAGVSISVGADRSDEKFARIVANACNRPRRLP